MSKVSQQEGDLLGHAGSNANTHSDNLLKLLLHAKVQGIGGIITETFIHLQCALQILLSISGPSALLHYFASW